MLLSTKNNDGGRTRKDTDRGLLFFFLSSSVALALLFAQKPALVDSNRGTKRAEPHRLTAAAVNGSSLHDLAVVMMDAPRWVNVAAPKSSVTWEVAVGIQNRSDHDEIIDPDRHRGNGITTGIIRLKVDVIDDDDEGCEPAKVVIRPPAPIDRAPTRIRPMQGYSVTFDVTFRCTAPKPRDRKDRTPWDYSFSATVHHEVLDGNPDADPSDDVCPRQPIAPKRGLEDRGCGWKLRGQPFGPYVTDVILKSPKKP